MGEVEEVGEVAGQLAAIATVLNLLPINSFHWHLFSLCRVKMTVSINRSPSYRALKLLGSMRSDRPEGDEEG